MASPLQDPLAWVHRFSQRLMARQERYQKNEDYAIGNHPLPQGDPRFVKELQKIQKKARTNYVGLANKAVTDRMQIKGFRFGDPKKLDPDARRFWEANNMAIQANVAIKQAAKLGDVYAMVSPPREEGGDPIITIEDPRMCITEPDPLDPLSSIAGMKMYIDSVNETVIAVLILPERVDVFDGPKLGDFLSRETSIVPEAVVNTGSAWRLRESFANPLGYVYLFRGQWQPEYGIVGMAECEDGGYDIQDRINETILSRIVISRSQAYRQRWMTGAEPPPAKKGKPVAPPFEGGAAAVWAMADPQAKFGDFEQADIRQLLEAVRDDVGDFAAVTQTPVTYLTNKLVNVAAETMGMAQIGLVSKTNSRKQSMGWFFEQIIKTCFAYKGDARATEVMAEAVWVDSEQHTMAEKSDMVSKLSAAGVPPQVWGELFGFSEDQVELIATEMERLRQEQMAQDQKLADSKKQDPKKSSPPGE